ncbi:MAG: ChbG/HpnK family deacetylase [Myxococcaceae bacterium]
MRRIELVITADDFGIHRRRDAGIIEAFRRGAITQASLIVNGEHAARAANVAREVGLTLGLHLNFTEGATTAPVATVRSLVDARGELLGKHGFRAAVRAGRISADDLRREAFAQLGRFAELTGAAATHVDGHQHAHALIYVARAISPLLASQGVRTTRIPHQRQVLRPANQTARAFYETVSEEARAARPLFGAYGIRSVAAFVGLDLMGFDSSPSRLTDALLGADSDAVELMCHPGFPADAGDDFNRSGARWHELSVLCAVQPRLSRHVSLKTFSTLSSEVLS